MADEPKCRKCGGPRTPMKRGKGKGIWFLGCVTCAGKPKGDDKSKAEEKSKADDKKKGIWLDDYL